jgi:hypothetical protein
MPRLNQSRRQKIGYVYCPQVDNNISLPPSMRNMAIVQEQSFEQNMTGQGVQDIIRGIMNHKQQILHMGNKAVDIASSDAVKQVGKIVFDNLPHDKQDKITRLKDRIKPVNNAIQRRQDIADMIKSGTKMYKDMSGAKATSIQGNGINNAGGDIDIRGNQEGDVLPGDMLRKKLLQKMIRERRMRSLGDRVKTSPIKDGFNGGSLVIPTINNKMGSQSMSKTLPSTKPYKLNPRPLVGAGSKQKGGFIIAGLVALGTAIASAISASLATTVIGSVTVGSLAGAALTGASSAAGAALVKKIAGDGIKDNIVKTVKDTKIMFKNLPKADQEKIKNGLINLKKNPSKTGVISFAKSIAPIALKATKKELQPRITKVFKDAGLSGKGLKLAGQGLGLSGAGEKNFKNEFVKNLVKKIS